jgi:sirohydrochlorin ferrochelatase
VVIVDHGSTKAESNALVEQVAQAFAGRYPDAVVEPAHMELAFPSIADAYARCRERGASEIIVCPFFLGPGKHWTHDIPALTTAAAQAHPGATFRIAAPLGFDELILDLLAKRMREAE